MIENKTNAKLDTIIICTARIKELSQFYKLGFQLQKPKSHESNHVGFQIQNNYLGFDKIAKEQISHPGAISLWFRVDNIKETFNRFKELGAQVKYPPTKKPWGDVLAALFDPDGNIIGLAQR